VRSIRAPRAKASERNEIVDTLNPAEAPQRGVLISGSIRKSWKWPKATRLMGP
jgi:hypothetical protein